MKKVYEPLVQARIDAYQNRILAIQKELRQEFEMKMNQRTGHLQEALTTLHSENHSIGYEVTEHELIELEEINGNPLDNISIIDQELGLYLLKENNNG